MKISYLILILVAATGPALAHTEASERVMEAVTQKASNGDLRGLGEALPSLEAVWDEDPQAYLESLKTTVHALIASGNEEAVKAAMGSFPKLIEKKAPAARGTEAVLNYMKLKYSILNDYYQVPKNHEDKEFMLQMASFLGEVRGLRIPGYKIRYHGVEVQKILGEAGVAEVKDLPTQAQKDAVAAAKRKAEEDDQMNDLQNALFSSDWSTFNTIQTCFGRGRSVPDAEKPAFSKELIRRGKLTEEEVKELGLPQGR